jgi:uncharacterized DUF497 family protein
MGFQWDDAKYRLNFRKHLVTFRQAAQIFSGPILQGPDGRRDYGEPRFVAIGMSSGVVLRVIFTLRDDDIRIISAWKASRNDRARYEKFIQEREAERQKKREPDGQV